MNTSFLFQGIGDWAKVRFSLPNFLNFVYNEIILFNKVR